MNTILWTEEAKTSFDSIIDYLLVNWGVKTALEFEEKVDLLINNLEQHLYICPSSIKKPELRRCVVNKRISMVYQVVDTVVFIVNFFDNRSDNKYT